MLQVDYDPIWTTPNIVVITKGGVQTIKTELCEDCLARQVQEVCEDCYELKAECVCNAEIEPFILKVRRQPRTPRLATLTRLEQYTSSIEGHVRRECFACKNYGRCLAFPRGSHWPGTNTAAAMRLIPSLTLVQADCTLPLKPRTSPRWYTFASTASARAR